MEVQRIALSIFYITFFVGNVFSQGGDDLENIFRINFINPALEYEKITGDYSVISGAAGIGYGGSYRELEIQGNGFVYIVSPFVDIQYKLFYNRKKRLSKGKSIAYNSGNYVSLRGITRFFPLTENIIRTDETDFAIGPTWGLQRTYGKIHFLFDIGPQYYFDTKGNGGFFPIMAQINIGFNISSK